MHSSRCFFLLALLCLAPRAAPGEDSARMTVFALADGGKVQALHYMASTVGGATTYAITTLDGQRMLVREQDIRSRTEELVPLARLPEAARTELRKARAAAAAAQNAAEARAAVQRAMVAAKRTENEALAAAKAADADVAAALDVFAKAEALLKIIPARIAQANARYDASKAELSGLAGLYESIPGRADYLRSLMERAAADKAVLEGQKKEAEEIVARTQGAVAQLRARLETAQMNLAAARAETRMAILRSRDEARELAAEPDGGLRIGKAADGGAMAPQPDAK